MNEKGKSARRVRQARLTREGGFRLLLGSGGIVVLMLSFLACAPQTRYEVLSFFFDGVPDPNVRELPPEEGGGVPPRAATSFQDRTALAARKSTITLISTPPREFRSYSAGESAFARRRVGEDDTDVFHHQMERKQCLICHNSAFGLEPTVRIEAEFCDQCHEEKRKREGPSHGDYRMSHCFPCHQGGHSSPYPEFRQGPAAEQCLVCHDKDSIAKKTKAQLEAEAKVKAATFTPGVLPTLEGADRFEERRTSATLVSFAHHQMEKDKCLICHSETNALKPVVEITRDFCDQCHGEKRKSEGWNHASINVGDCQACHLGGHESPQPKLLREPIADLCHFCHHEGEVKEMSLHTIKALRIDADDCTVCHDPHRVF